MSKLRTKMKVPAIATREQAERSVNLYAQTANRKRALLAERDARVLAINNDYETSLGELDEVLEAEKIALCDWAQTHPDEFAKDRKSIEFLAGVIGFRTGTPKLALLNRRWNWDTVLEALRLRAGRNYIREIEEVDKAKILSEVAADKFGCGNLEIVGLKVVQDESFYVDPNLADAEAKQTVEVKS